jgi:hypothetical protein
MPRDLLSDARIRNAKPHETPYKMHDGAGLYLHVQTNGSKYWRLKFRYLGKEESLCNWCLSGRWVGNCSRGGRESTSVNS